LESFFSGQLSYFLLEGPNFENSKITVNFEISQRDNEKKNQLGSPFVFTFLPFIGRIDKPIATCIGLWSFDA
jgi:hypothetical protein